MTCCVLGCDKYTGMCNKLARIPKDNYFRNIWLQNIKNPFLFGLDSKKLNNYRVCIRHFETEHINDHASNTQSCLKQGAIPTLFLNESVLNSAFSDKLDIRKRYEEYKSVPNDDYYQRQETVNTEGICALSEQSNTDLQACLQMETQKSDMLNDNITFEQCKYNSNALQGIHTDSSTTFRGFSICNLPRCRLCTVQYPIMMLTSIFDNQRANRYLKMLEMCLPIKMHKKDGLPHNICYSCFVKLEQCYELLNKFRNAYHKHREKIILTDEQNQIDTTPINTVPVSSENKSSESNNNDIGNQNDNKIEANLQHISPVCSKLLSSQNNLISHNLGEHLLLESEIDINKQADKHVKKTIVKNIKKQCGNKDENIQNNGQSLDFVVGENGGKVNHFSTERNSRECESVNTDTADVCSGKSAETALNNDIKVSDNDTLMSTAGRGISKLRLKKINELTHNTESNKYQVKHCDNSQTFTVNIVKEKNTSNAAPMKLSTNNGKTSSNLKIKLIYECSFCHKLLINKKRIVEHCIAVHKTCKDEKITCRQLKTIVTGNGVEPSLLLNAENIRMDNTDVDTKDSESHKYAYECVQCSKQLATKEDLISHCVANKCLDAQNKIVCKQVKLKSMPVEVRYQSKQCDASFTEPQARITHTLECHSVENTTKSTYAIEPGEVRYQCKQCNASFADHQAGAIHTYYHHSKQRKTKVKPANKTSKNSVKQHFKLHTSHKTNNSCLCMYCGVIRTKMKLIQHERIHSNERPFECAVCLKTFRTANACATHKEIHNTYKNYICHRCGRACNTQKRLCAHMKTHLPMEERPFMCEVCGKRFGRSDHYKRHKTRHTEIVASQVQTEYKCLICHKVFKSGARLNVHVKRAHVNKVQYNCHECGKTFRTKYRFTIHRYLHTGEKPYKCNLCHKAFRCRATRYQHGLVHKSDAPYMCDICGKRFKRPGHLKLHKQCHSSDKSYICNVCGKAFQRKKGLSDHQKRHTGVELKTEVVATD